MEITHYFFSNTIGIVRVDDPHDGIKYYIKAVNGHNLNTDINDVANWGNRFPFEAGETLFECGYMAKAITK